MEAKERNTQEEKMEGKILKPSYWGICVRF